MNANTRTFIFGMVAGAVAYRVFTEMKGKL